MTAATERSFAQRVTSGVLWRSGSQVFAQLVTWTSTFLVIRLLSPADYGLFAMTQTVLTLFGLLSGWSFANALIRQPEVTRHEIAQVFGLLILANGGLALIQLAIAPVLADYYNQPLVTDLLRVQVLLYAANPAISLASALLSRELDYRGQAIANFASAIAGAGTALGGALAGWGVWTLVAAPIAMFWVRAIGMTIAARLWVMPSFDLRGTAKTFSFGIAMLVSQLFWFIQTQADVFIGGRHLDATTLGLYTTALFLAQILTSKFIPPMNEVAFAAYARLQHDRAAVAAAFAKQVRMMMLVALPFYIGMAVTAQPLVMVTLGDHWAGAGPLLSILAWVMPCLTLQILFSPVTNALGQPRLSVYGAMAGAVIMPTCYLIGIRFGAEGLAWAWAAGFPLLTLFTAAISLPVIGITTGALLRAIGPALLASLGMGAVVLAVDLSLPPLVPIMRLVVLVAVGAVVYAALAWLVARPVLVELRGLLMRRQLA